MFILNNITQPPKQGTHAEQFPADGSQSPAVFDMDESQLKNKSGANNQKNAAWLAIQKGDLICVIGKRRMMEEIQIVDELCHYESTKTWILRADVVARFKSSQLYPQMLEEFSVVHKHIRKGYFFVMGGNVVNLGAQLDPAEIELSDDYRNLVKSDRQSVTIGDLKKMLNEQLHAEDLWQEGLEPQSGHWEGSKTTVYVNKYERSIKARNVCIDHHGTDCYICKQNMTALYGEVATGLIHVHHIKALAEIGESYQVDPIKDLVPVCPNCHAVIHRKYPPYSVQEVAEMYALKSKSSRYLNGR
jgi:predicted HNH restriction endonuclease